MNLHSSFEFANITDFINNFHRDITKLMKISEFEY